MSSHTPTPAEGAPTPSSAPSKDPHSAIGDEHEEYQSAKGCLMLAGLTLATVAFVVAAVLIFGGSVAP
ncbi:MAG: hypothetical protein ACIARQ_02320 [Phycisphaerales bacterium JB061]